MVKRNCVNSEQDKKRHLKINEVNNINELEIKDCFWTSISKLFLLIKGCMEIIPEVEVEVTV
jgi:hypothetical protein